MRDVRFSWRWRYKSSYGLWLSV